MTAQLQLSGIKASRLLHYQATPAAEWTFTHNLASKPAVLLFLDSDPTEPVFTDVTYPDLSTITVSWPVPVAGWVYY